MKNWIAWVAGTSQIDGHLIVLIGSSTEKRWWTSSPDVVSTNLLYYSDGLANILRGDAVLIASNEEPPQDACVAALARIGKLP